MLWIRICRIRIISLDPDPYQNDTDLMELDLDPRFSDHPFWILTQINGNPPTKKEICLEILSFDLFFCICSEPDGSDSYSDHMIRIQGWAFVHELLPNP